jgi:hypothetical protein
MSEFYNVINQTIENRLVDLHTVMPCKVDSFDHDSGTANVIPLFKIKYVGQEAQQRPMLIDVPVLKQKYKVISVVQMEKQDDGTYLQVERDLTTPVIKETDTYYEKGDIVAVAFFERAYDMVKDGSIADPVYSRKHSLEDGVILGKLG